MPGNELFADRVMRREIRVYRLKARIQDTNKNPSSVSTSLVIYVLKWGGQMAEVFMEDTGHFCPNDPN